MAAIGKGVKYLEGYTQRIYDYIEKSCLDIGDKCDKYMDDTSARRKYWCEVLLRVPLIFITHQWLLLSPYSNYWMIDVVLFVVRYGGALLFLGRFAFNSGVLLQVYIYLTLDIAITWIRHMDYWTNQDSAYGICHEKNVLVWFDLTDNITLPLICSIILQLVYLCVRPGALNRRWEENGSSLIYLGLLSSLIPKILSSLSIFPAFMSECSYWIDNTLLVGISFLEVVTLNDVDARVDGKKLRLLNLKHKLAIDDDIKLKYRSAIEELGRRIDNRKKVQNIADRFPGKWFVRDTMLLFGITYLFLLLLIEVTVYQRPIMSMVTGNTFLELCTMWCSSHLIVVFISYCFGLISNVTVALSHWFLTIEFQLVDAFNTNIGEIVQFVVMMTFIEANVLALENFEKLDVMKLIAFLSIYAIIFQTLDVLEQKILQAVNSGTSPGMLYYIRACILICLLITIPSLSTLLFAKSLNISPWLLFFASGNGTLLLRTTSLVLECALIKITWYTTNHLTNVEDALHYTRVCKTLTLVFLNCAQSYCRYICTFFKGWWLLRLCLALFSFVAVAGLLGLSEFGRYKTRTRMFTILRNLQDVTCHKKAEESDEGDTDECVICYIKMTKAKKLPCNHVFHNDCLRRWFQVRTACPLCNTEIRAENVQVQHQQT